MLVKALIEKLAVISEKDFLEEKLLHHMKYFLYKLIPPRPSFSQDMTESEGKMMQEHVGYWKDLADRGIVIIFGPVIDPKGAYGLAIIEMEDESMVGDIGTNDPAIKAAIGFRFEINSMPKPILRK